MPYLLDFVNDQDPAAWEYATVAVSALGRYEGEAVVQALKEAIKSPNWYIRYAAAQSLEAHHLSYDLLTDIVNGNDRYAREMMLYRMELSRLQEAGNSET